jgi:hypothetical protein
MNPPEEVIVDRASLAEYKKIMAEVQADADFQMKKATQSMSAGDRTKLNRLLKQHRGSWGRWKGRGKESCQ